MATLNQELPSPILRHEDILRKAFRLVAPCRERWRKP